MPKPDEKLLKEAEERFDRAVTFESRNRKQAVEDLQFLDGNQWPADVARQREIKRRPMMVFNRLPGLVDQVVGDAIQTKTSIQVVAVGGTAENVTNLDGTKDYDLAEIVSGLIRDIEYKSNAQDAYLWAEQNCVECGYGAFRIKSRYVDDDVFEQELCVEKVFNQFSVYLDPIALLKGPEHMEWGFVIEELIREEFEEKYPNRDKDRHSWEKTGVGDESSLWVTEDNMRVVDYFRVVTGEATICLLSDGRVIDKAEVAAVVDELEMMGVQVVDERKTDRRRVEQYKLGGGVVLDKSEWPGRYIPIVPVYGKTLNNEGYPVLRGLIRHSKDAQRAYNYWRTSSAEYVALQPKAPFIGTAKQFGKFENLWKSANLENFSYIPYEPDDQAPGAPQRQMPPPPPTGMVQEAMSAADDIKATSSIYDASVGASGNETSGRAILARQSEGDTATSAFHDAMRSAIRYAGTVIVDALPYIYDTDRVIRIRGLDESEDYVRINETIVDEETGESVDVANLAAQKFDLKVTTGAPFNTQRQEAVTSMLELFRVAPDLAQLAADIMARNMDWPGADELTERIKRTMPPEITGDKDALQQGEETLPDEERAGAEEVEPPIEVQLALRKETAEVEKAEANAEKAKADAGKAVVELETARREAEVNPDALYNTVRDVTEQALSEYVDFTPQ